MKAGLSVFHTKLGREEKKKKQPEIWLPLAHGESNQNNINYTLMYNLYYQMCFFPWQTI